MTDVISGVKGRDAQLALLLSSKWRGEIERAIEHVKQSRKRSQLDKWFRKQWYRARAIRRRKERGLAFRSHERSRSMRHY